MELLDFRLSKSVSKAARWSDLSFCLLLVNLCIEVTLELFSGSERSPLTSVSLSCDIFSKLE